MHLRSTWRGRLARFGTDRSGSVATIFALCLIGASLTAGLAIDYGRGVNLHVSMQNDLDAALLGAASRAAEADEVEAIAKDFFDENWKQKYGITEDVAVAISQPTATMIRGTANVTVPTTFMAISGLKSFDVRVTSEIELAGESVEVALVLDVTDSMAGTKIDALKASAAGLIDKAYATEDARDNVKISIVPFADYVNVGLGNRNESWISVPADTSETREICQDDYRELTGTSNCRTETGTYDRDGVPTSYDYEVCDYEYGPPQTRCFNSTTVTQWNGCAASRNYPLDVSDEDYSTPVPGAMNVSCGQALTPLSNDPDLLKTSIDAITTFGNTYIPAGLLWGWATLSPGAPYSEGVAYGAKVNGIPVKKSIVLMTDGANTRSPNYASALHNSVDVTLANQRTAELCTNIKDAGIEIYTVAFEVADAGIKDEMRACASSATHFFDAEDSEELQTAFENIGATLSPVRIAR